MEEPGYRLDRYDAAWALEPIWRGNTLYNESVLLAENAAGEIFAPLLYYPGQRALRARQHAANGVYRGGGL